MAVDFFRQALPRIDLIQRGPLVELLVAVSVPEEDRLAALGRVAPAPVRIVALVDTGASISAIPEGVVATLGLDQRDVKVVEGYDGAVRRHPAYDVRFVSTQGGVAMKVRPIAIADTDRPVESVIGRDVLAQCLLRYDGYHGRFDLAIVGP
jgi:hypothetical protein